MTSLLVLIDRLLTINNLLHWPCLVSGLFLMVFASTVRFTTNTALTGPSCLGFVGWVVKWIYCFTDW